MTETNEIINSSVIDTIKNYISSKRMIYLVAAIILGIGIYYYINKNKKVEEKESTNINNNQEPEIILSQELVENLYRNNSNPIQYLSMLQQQGQIPQGPLPKIVLDYTIQNPQQTITQPIPQQTHESQGLNNVNEKKDISSVTSDQINYEDNVEAQTSNISYQKIEDDEEDIVNQKLTKEEIENINRKILNK